MSYTFTEDTSVLYRWIRDEVELESTIKRGKRGIAARRVQEWLSLNGFSLVIDGDYGRVTEMTVAEFQHYNGLNETGEVNDATWRVFVRRMMDVLRRPNEVPDRFDAAMLKAAERHLAVHPRETGGQNMGPWVRLYMKGNEGHSWPWCAGFTTFLMEQASEITGKNMPMEGSFSCDWLAANAKAKGTLVPEHDAGPNTVPPGSLFLVRRTSTDWTHTGLVVEAGRDLFKTIEGNTNDEGSREGYEVCARRRGYGSKDFIIFPE